MMKYRNSQNTVILSFVSLFLLCLLSYAEPLKIRKARGRIVGGSPANITEFPYQLALEYFNFDEKLLCGAIIIHRFWALTAAHCVHGRPENTLRLRSGSSFKLRGGMLHQILKLIVHPKHVRAILDYDVCIIKVYTPFHFNDVTQRIPLASETPSTGTPAVALGWGALKHQGYYPEQLQQVTVYIEDHEICKQDYNDLYAVTPSMLCAGVHEGGKDACDGDSGGPLVAENKLVGISSWGLFCADKHYPGVYADVAKVYDWVISYINK